MMFDLCRTLPPSQPGLSKQHEAEEIFANGPGLQQVQQVSLKWFSKRKAPMKMVTIKNVDISKNRFTVITDDGASVDFSNDEKLLCRDGGPRQRADRRGSMAALVILEHENELYHIAPDQMFFFWSANGTRPIFTLKCR